MQRNSNFFRLIFLLVAITSTTSYELSTHAHDAMLASAALGVGKGLALTFLVFAFEAQVKKLSARTFNSAVIGIVLGTAMGWAITNAMKTLFSIFTINPTNQLFDFFALAVYLGALYFSLIVSYTASEKWWLSIPFVKLSPVQESKNKQILIDISALEDTRLMDLARTGLVDNKLVLPSFIAHEIQKRVESQDEIDRNRFKKCAETIKQLENMPNLGFTHKDFSADNDSIEKNILKAAKLSHYSIIASDNLSLKQPEAEGVQIICLESLANSIKPTAQRGETLSIKIQRPGKEPKQGVGYLEDGTMVVVNGGGDFLSKTITTQVLSQKYSTSGKIIFCNAIPPEDGAISASATTPYHIPQSQKQETFAQIPRYRKDSNDSWNRH